MSRADSNSEKSRNAGVTPLLIGRDNAEAVVGRPFRWVRDAARALGVPVLVVGRCALVPAQSFLDALLRAETEGTETLPPLESSSPAPDSADQVLARLGLKRRSA